MRYIWILALALAMGCSTVVIKPLSDKYCLPACDNLRALDCPEGYPLEDGTPCEVFCSYMQKNGHDLHPKCVSKAASCEAAEACND